MTPVNHVEHNRQGRPRGWIRTFVGGGIKILFSAAVLVGAAAVYRHQIRTSPRAGRQKPPTQARLVQVVPVRKADCVTTVTAMGPVMPAQQVTLRPQITGQIVEISEDVIPGGFVEAGQKLFAVDDRDYKILVQQRQSDVARTLRDLKVEQGNQAVARREYELLGEVVSEEDRELVLREPQLASAEAAYRSAQAALEKARLDLSRCTITAPFNAIVREKSVDLGATVSLNSNLVTLVGTDQAWIELKVPLGKLKWIAIPRSNGVLGSEVKVYDPLAWGRDRFRTGRVLCLAGELEPQGLLTRLLVDVDDPFCLKPENRDQPQVLIGSFVSAEIQGRTLESVFPIARPYYRDGDTVWIMNDANELEIRPVAVVFREPEHVYVNDGLAENEWLVVTDIAAPVAGMPLRAAEAEEEAEQQARAAAGPEEDR